MTRLASLPDQLRAVGIAFEQEVQFAKPRRWRADFVVTAKPVEPCYGCDRAEGYCRWHSPLLIEIDGGTWSGGRHVTGAGYLRDLEKLNKATILGYRVLRVTPAMVESGAALTLIERALR